MNRIYSLLFTLLTATVIACSGTRAYAAPTLTEAADSAYLTDHYKEAAALYTAAIDSLGPSSDLYYNLGNTMFRLGKPGQAILAYERALRLDPTNSDARANLEFVNSRIIDRPGERGSLVGNMLDSGATALHSNTWAWIAFGAFILFLCAMGAYLFGSAVIIRKTGFFGGFIILLFAIIAAFLSARGAAIATSDAEAIITAQSTILSTSPRRPVNRSQEAMLLHEGTRVIIRDSVTSRADSVPVKWYDVAVDNTHSAWINAADVERIHMK